MKRLRKVFWLGTKELRALMRDRVLLVFLVYSFSVAIYLEATGISTDVHHASIGIVDEDRSTLSARISNAYFPPSFQTVESIEARDVDRAMDSSRYIFVLAIPPNFERDVIERRPTELQLNIDATAMGQAGVGANYIQSIIESEVNRFVSDSDTESMTAIRLVTRRAFNPNGNPVWFGSLMALISSISMLTIILTGAALIREREHETIEHLLVMPLTSLDIALAKIWSNALIILLAVSLALLLVIQGLLDVPIAGSRILFLAATATYLLFATALGVFLGTISRTMAQFALLVTLTIVVLQMLSGSITPVESQPEWLQPITFFLPSRHFVSIAQAVVYRGAGFDLVWESFIAVAAIAMAFFIASLALFRRSIAIR
ncbi:MAG: ABC transporter permease [Planctomycetota bacterium]